MAGGFHACSNSCLIRALWGDIFHELSESMLRNNVCYFLSKMQGVGWGPGLFASVFDLVLGNGLRNIMDAGFRYRRNADWVA